MSAKELRNLLDQAEKRIQQQEILIEALQRGEKLNQIIGGENSLALEERRDDFDKKSDSLQNVSQAEMNQQRDDIKVPMDKPKTLLDSSKARGPNLTLTVLRQHISLVNLQEELSRLKIEKNELNLEVEAKNAEIYEVLTFTGK